MTVKLQRTFRSIRQQLRYHCIYRSVRFLHTDKSVHFAVQTSRLCNKSDRRTHYHHHRKNGSSQQFDDHVGHIFSETTVVIVAMVVFGGWTPPLPYCVPIQSAVYNLRTRSISRLSITIILYSASLTDACLDFFLRAFRNCYIVMVYPIESFRWFTELIVTV